MLDCNSRVYAGRMRKMKFIDMHCDTMLHLMNDRTLNLKENPLCVDTKKMRQANQMAQFFACFVNKSRFPGEHGWDEAYDYVLQMIAHSKQCIADVGEDMKVATCYQDIVENDMQGKMSAILTIEEGGILNGQLSRLEELYELGIRLITLTWNHENCIGYPNKQEGGLKPFGFEVIEKMNKLGIIVDVSHLSDQGFWDVLQCSHKPIVASHSNARSLCPHARNVTDEMIKSLAEKGGGIGVNFYPYFINDNGRAKITDIVQHITYMYQVGGEDVVVIGTDFDGFDDGQLELADVSQLRQVYEELKIAGFIERQIEKFFYKNALRLIKDICGNR